jgi:predicted TIM-barrel fold metal-dependent hydrolase
MDRHLVISSDCHAGLPPDKYRDYLDPEHRELFDQALPIQLEMTKKASEMFLVEEENVKWREGNEDALTGAWDHDERIKVLNRDGIAAEIVFADGITEMNSPPFGASIGMPTEGVVPELQWAGARAHNRWLAELVQMAPERHFGVALIPCLWDVDTNLREIHWCKENGINGIMLPVTWGSQAPYHHPKYDPMWALCEELGMVIHFHSGGAPTSDYFGEMPPTPDSIEMPGAVGIYISEVCMFNVRPLTFLIWGGIFERYPKIKVAITEGTSIWVPHYLELLDQRYSQTHFSAKMGDYYSHLSLKPSEYFARNVRLGASCMPRREAELRHDIGLGNIMWGSDYPHPEGTWPHTRNQMIDTFKGLPEDEVAKMLGGNALEFYGFDAEKLAPVVAEYGPEKSLFVA